MRESKVGRRLAARFDQIEDEGLCLIAESESDRRALEARVRSGDVVSPWPGMFVRKGHYDKLKKTPRLMNRCVLRTFAREHPDAVFCSFSAAVIYGLWVPTKQLKRIFLLAASPEQRAAGVAACSRSRSMRVDRRACKGSGVVRQDGMLVTDVEGTLFECALAAALPEALAILDCALRYELTSKERLLGYALANGRGRHGRAGALRAIMRADGRADNGGESIVRGLIIELGYTPPTDLQVEFEDPVELGRMMRADAVWKLDNGAFVIGEIDGLEKYRDEESMLGWSLEAMVRERHRESHLTALGCPVMRIQYSRAREAGYLEGLLRAYGIPRLVE